ncbi:hypothetical protein V1514DRAFT_83711 [Lipomyces japonicus]|uniref:uncharacterized protein n=1 Tax=Lipomyces japonicus TaxID=56871 RepID=UPI0034CF8E4F
MAEGPDMISLTPGNQEQEWISANWPAATEPPSNSNPVKHQVWLVFGATGVIGRQICRMALSQGDMVMACSRNVKSVVRVPERWQERLQIQSCDVRSRQMVKESVDRTLQRWNRIDVVVACASAGVVGACEEQDEHEVRAQFETNVMGLFHVVQTTVPFLRLRGNGRYVVLSSLTGMVGTPGLGPFSGTKWAVEGLVESLAYEVAGQGCRATLVYPGTFDSDEASRSPPWRHFVIKPMTADYSGTPAEYGRRLILWLNPTRPTNVNRIGAILWELAHCRNPPLRLALGSDAVATMRDKLRHAVEEVEDWKFLYGTMDED